jgi:D-mannonate dehydratase
VPTPPSHKHPHAPPPRPPSYIEVLRQIDLDAVAAAAVEDIKAEEWQLDAIEKRKEQAEVGGGGGLGVVQLAEGR